jgi:pimeloyl-ACP methyl ester carboxylesterase
MNGSGEVDGIPEVEPLGRFPDVAEPEKRAVNLHGHRIVCRVGGGQPQAGRPVLVLIHGIAGSSATWNAVLPALVDRYTVVALDLLGHGESDKSGHDYSLGAYANMVRDVMIALGIDRATIVGHSYGGGVAMQFVYQHPSRCERLVLESSGGLGQEISWIFRALSVPAVEYLMPLIFPSAIRVAGNLVGDWTQRLGVRAPNLAQSWRAYAELTKAENRSAFLDTLRSVIDRSGQTVSAHDRLYLTAWVPTLIVWGKSDRIIPVEHAIAAHEAIASSELVIFERVGHFPHAEEPERFVDALTTFIDTTAPMHLDEPKWRAALTAGPRRRRNLAIPLTLNPELPDDRPPKLRSRPDQLGSPGPLRDRQPGRQSATHRRVGRPRR